MDNQSSSTAVKMSLPKFSLWEKMLANRRAIDFELEITPRCNHFCVHCYINVPPRDEKAKSKELTLDQINDIADQAVDLGAVWCLITGGEPLLREDFFDIYLSLKKKGLLVSVFTNASLISEKHIEFFKKYPPRDIEVTVYGVTKETYERVCGRKGSFEEFSRGVKLLLEGGIKVRFKTVAIRSNLHEFEEIAKFCREHTKDYFKFDPIMHLRYDGDPVKNQRIKRERLTPQEIVAVENSDPLRSAAMKKGCGNLTAAHEHEHEHGCHHTFSCAAGLGNFAVSYDGNFRLCQSLFHPDAIYDLKKGSLKDAFLNFVPKVREMRSKKAPSAEYKKYAQTGLCVGCTAYNHLETGDVDNPGEYFQSVTQERLAEAFDGSKNNLHNPR